MSNPKRLRILLSAYFCSPYRGGESAVGWNVATQLAKHHDVTVICGDLNPESLTAKDHVRYAKENSPIPNLSIIHIQANSTARFFNRVHRLPGLWFLFYFAYKRWQIQALGRAKQLHSEVPFDVVHHSTVIGFREPGYLWTLGIPFFWGPVSGCPMVPKSFLREFSLKERFRWHTRNLINYWQLAYPGRSALAAKAASQVWAVSKEDLAAIQSWGADALPMLETGTLNSPYAKRRFLAENSTLRICWSGLFQGIKALPVVLKAISRLQSQRIELHVLGKGPEERAWKKLSVKLGISGQIVWHGMLPREQALSIMDQTCALVHSSVKEGTPHVVLEALSMGIPVICHDVCGMGIAVDERCGLKIPLVDPETSTEGFRKAIHQLITDFDLMPQLSAGAIQRAKELSWESNTEKFSQAYISGLRRKNLARTDKKCTPFD